MILAWNLKNLKPDAASGRKTRRLGAQLETLAQQLVAQHLRMSPHVEPGVGDASTARTASTVPVPANVFGVSGDAVPALRAGPRRLRAPLRHCVVVASAPVRVDLAGGWSDTPPICYESAGAVSVV